MIFNKIDLCFKCYFFILKFFGSEGPSTGETLSTLAFIEQVYLDVLEEKDFELQATYTTTCSWKKFKNCLSGVSSSDKNTT